MDILTTLTSSGTRSHLLRLFFGPTPESLHLREIQRRTSISPGALHRELDKLVRAGLLVSRQDGNRVVFSANTNQALFEPLRDLVRKSARGCFGQDLGNAESMLRSPPPGGAIEHARDFGVDLSLMLEQLRRTPNERVRRLQQSAADLTRIRGVANTSRATDA